MLLKLRPCSRCWQNTYDELAVGFQRHRGEKKPAENSLLCTFKINKINPQRLHLYVENLQVRYGGKSSKIIIQLVRENNRNVENPQSLFFPFPCRQQWSWQGEKKIRHRSVHCKEKVSSFPLPSGMSLTKLSLAGNNFIYSRPGRV